MVIDPLYYFRREDIYYMDAIMECIENFSDAHSRVFEKWNKRKCNVEEFWSAWIVFALVTLAAIGLFKLLGTRPILKIKDFTFYFYYLFPLFLLYRQFFVWRLQAARLNDSGRSPKRLFVLKGIFFILGLIAFICALRTFGNPIDYIVELLLLLFSIYSFHYFLVIWWMTRDSKKEEK